MDAESRKQELRHVDCFDRYGRFHAVCDAISNCTGRIRHGRIIDTLGHISMPDSQGLEITDRDGRGGSTYRLGSHRFVLKGVYDNRKKKMLSFEEAGWIKDGFLYYPAEIIERDKRILEEDIRITKIMKDVLPLRLVEQCEYLGIDYEEVLFEGVSRPESRVIEYLRSRGHTAYFSENFLIPIIEARIERRSLKCLMKQLWGEVNFATDRSFQDQLIEIHGKKEWKQILDAGINGPHQIPVTWRDCGGNSLGYSNGWGWPGWGSGWPDIICRSESMFSLIEVKVKDKLTENQVSAYTSAINKAMKIPWKVMRIKRI